MILQSTVTPIAQATRSSVERPCHQFFVPGKSGIVVRNCLLANYEFILGLIELFYPSPVVFWFMFQQILSFLGLADVNGR